ncbi:Serine/threonine-protein kinase sax-1 [Leucoagaricus sp. SymC.cos]|nr:Serine/threonine-protein kinase sax-1 [Leucoagaricus sp. SymC.cos]
MLDLPTLYITHILSFLMATVTFIGRKCGSVAALLGFVTPPALLKRLQATTAIVTLWVLVPLKGSDLPESSKLNTVSLLCFLAMTGADSIQWPSETWVKSAWLLLACSYTSFAVFGRLSFGITRYLTQWLLLYLWNIGLLRIQTLRQDAMTRMYLVASALLDRVPFGLHNYFFGLIPGLSNFFDPWLPPPLELAKSIRSREVTQDDPFPFLPASSMSSDSITGVERSCTEDEVTDDLSDTSDTACIEESMDNSTPAGSHQDLVHIFSCLYASSPTLVSASEGKDATVTTTTPFLNAITSKTVSYEKDQEELHDPLSFFDCKESFMQDLVLDRCLGTGSFGTVYRGSKKGNQLYALKIMKQGPRENSTITLEVAALRRIKGNSEWASQLEHLQFSNDNVLLAMTYYPGGSLLDILGVYNGAIPSEAAKFYVAQLILAIHSIHVFGIIHHDIKLDNIMLDAWGNVKLIDFGLAVTFDHATVHEEDYPDFVELRKYGGDQFPLLWATRHNPHTVNHTFGTEGYTAPEVWKGKLHSFGVDYFGAACVYHWLITGTAPFDYDPKTDDFVRDRVYIYGNEFSMSDDEYSFLCAALHQRPHKRLTVGQMKNHPLFAGICSGYYDPGHHGQPFIEARFTDINLSPTLHHGHTSGSPVASEARPEAFTDKIGRPGAGKQVLFVAFGTLFALSYAAQRTNIETEFWKKKLTSSSSTLSSPTTTTLDLKRAQQAEFVKGVRDWFADVQVKMQEFPTMIRAWGAGGLVAVLQPWVDASEGKRLCWKICMFNAAIWAAWKIPRWQPAMTVRFMHNPLSGLSYTLLTSTFSHRGLLHLLANCLALEGFGSAAYHFLVKEQGNQKPPMLESTASFHFMSFFISAGLFSGLVSHVVNTKFRYPRLVAQLASQAHSTKKVDTWASAVAASTSTAATTVAKKSIPEILPSLGASGAIYASVVVTALAFPDSQVALFIPPSYPINIQYGVGGLMLLDLIGIMRGWRVFDHWAHLGGAAFGAAYYAYGPSIWQSFRQGLEIEMPESK